jgi:hypothetical protein
MGIINTIITRAFDLALGPFAGQPWMGLTLVSALTGAVLILIFRHTSSQRRIRAVKDRIFSHLFEVVLYRDDMGVVVRAQARLAFDNLKYLGLALVPLVFMLIPVVLLLSQLDLRYGHRPLQVGERTIVQVKLAHDVDPDTVSLVAPEGIVIETAPLRIPSLNEVDWRLRATGATTRPLEINVGNEVITKEIVAGEVAPRVSLARVGSGLWQQFLHPGEPLLPRSSPVQSVTLTYPEAELTFFGHPIHWIWPWLIISMLVGYVLKGPLKVAV